jgi:NRPS condensation-like uncharacterized protein
VTSPGRAALEACRPHSPREERGAPARTLDLTPLEDAIVHSERSGSPITIELQVDLAGHLDESALRQAIHQAQRTHPLALARRQRVAALDRVQRWELVDANDVEPVTFRPFADAIELEAGRDHLLSEPIPLEAAPLFRVLHARLPDHDSVIFSVHHGAFDGLGCLAFLRTVAASYAGLPFDQQEADRTARFELVRRADGGPVAAGERRDGLRSYVEPVRAFTRAPRTARIQPSWTRAVVGYGITHRGVSLPAGRSMLDSRYHPRATANDVLVAALHLAIAEWNLDHGVVDDEIGVTVPVSGRRPTERAQVVANLTRQGATLTTRRDRSDVRRLLETISAQTTRLKRQGGNEPAAVLGAVSFVPAPVRRRLPALVSTMTRDRFVDTSRLSNLGRYDTLELSGRGFQVDRLWFSPPVRMPQGLTVGAVSLGESLYLSFRWCRALFDHPAAGRFADLYLDALGRLSEP